MFSIFKKNTHEPSPQQLMDVQKEPIGTLAIAGENCDEISGAQGPFGFSFNNPIPTNGLLGTFKYLAKLISPMGNVIYFHRLGSLLNDISKNPIDVYEVVDMLGGYWDIIFIDMYHPRRSNLAPKGFQLKPYDRNLGDLPFAFGVDIFCPNFPFDLPQTIESRNNLKAFARKVEDRVQVANLYQRPESQVMKLAAIQNKLGSIHTSIAEKSDANALQICTDIAQKAEIDAVLTKGHFSAFVIDIGDINTTFSNAIKNQNALQKFVSLIELRIKHSDFNNPDTTNYRNLGIAEPIRNFDVPRIVTNSKEEILCNWKKNPSTIN
jgi:hypothetical protein